MRRLRSSFALAIYCICSSSVGNAHGVAAGRKGPQAFCPSTSTGSRSCCSRSRQCGRERGDRYDAAFAKQLAARIGAAIGFTRGGSDCRPARMCYRSPVTEVACGSADPRECAAIPCSASPETIGDLIPGARHEAIPITDINGIWDGRGSAVGGRALGWVYLSPQGRFVQPNFANRAIWSTSLAKAFLPMFGIAVGQRDGYGAITQWNGLLPSGSFLLECESRGRALRSTSSAS